MFNYKKVITYGFELRPVWENHRAFQLVIFRLYVYDRQLIEQLKVKNY